MLKQILLGAVTLVLATTAYAGTKLIETTATGVGRDENEALADALANAVAQVNGTQSSMSVSTGTAVLEGQSKLTKEGTSDTTTSHGALFGPRTSSDTVKNSSTETAEASLTARTTPDVRMHSAGSVASFEKIGSKQRGDGKVEVTVKAKVKQHYDEIYNAAGSGSGKRRVAILSPTTDTDSYDFFGQASSAELSDQLWSAIESGVLRTGGVSVLDRKTLDASLGELGLVASDLTNGQEKAKLKLIRGADLIVMARIHAAEHRTDEQTIQITGQVKRYDVTHADVEIRAVVPATGEILLDKHYTLNEATDRASAFDSIAAGAGPDIVAVARGRSPSPELAASNVAIPPPAPPTTYAPPEPPRNEKGVKLPFDK